MYNEQKLRESHRGQVRIFYWLQSYLQIILLLLLLLYFTFGKNLLLKYEFYLR